MLVAYLSQMSAQESGKLEILAGEWATRGYLLPRATSCLSHLGLTKLLTSY